MKNFLKQFLTFDEMVTPKIITVIYWILQAGVVISSISSIVANAALGILYLVLGIIGVRIYCELIILFFNIYKQVKRIADNLDNKSSDVNSDNSTDD